MLWRKKIKTNTFRWLIFFFQYFCLGLHSYEQKKLLVKISDIYLFLRFCSHFFHLFRQWSNTPQNFVLCIVLFKENLQFVKQCQNLAWIHFWFWINSHCIFFIVLGYSEDLPSGSTYWLVTDWIHLARNSALQLTHDLFTSGSHVSTQSSNSRNSSTLTSELSFDRFHYILHSNS